MKVIKKSGLVPVKMLKSELPYKAGTIVGVKPETAAQMLNAQRCELVDIPEGYETIDVTVPILTPPKGQEKAAENDAAPVEIPEDWENLHHLKLVKLAKNFELGVVDKDSAIKVIAAEVERRAASQ